MCVCVCVCSRARARFTVRYINFDVICEAGEKLTCYIYIYIYICYMLYVICIYIYIFYTYIYKYTYICSIHIKWHAVCIDEGLKYRPRDLYHVRLP